MEYNGFWSVFYLCGAPLTFSLVGCVLIYTQGGLKEFDSLPYIRADGLTFTNDLFQVSRTDSNF